MSLHPTAASVNDDCRQQRPPLRRLPSTTNSVNNDHLCRRGQQSMTTGFWRSSLSTVWQQQWWLLMAAIAVVVDGSNNGMEPTAPMAALSTVAVVDGGGNKGIFTTTLYSNDPHPCPHCPCSRPLLDKDWAAGWRAHHDVSHLLLQRSLLLALSLSPLMG